MSERPQLDVAVIIERRKQANPWEGFSFRIADVALDDGAFGSGMRLLRDDGHTATFLHPGFNVALFRDEAEGYYLNLSSGQPVWFVMWRIDEDDLSRAWPERVMLSYNEAGRLLDAQEHVDNVPLPDAISAWLQAYTDAHYRPEPKRRARPASFRPPQQR